MNYSLLVVIFSSLLFIQCTTKSKYELKKKIENTSFGHEKIDYDTIIELKTAGDQLILVKEKFQEGKSIASIYLITEKYVDNIKTEFKDQDPLEDAFLYDLNLDGVDDLFLITRSTGSGSYGNVKTFLGEENKTLLPIEMPEISTDDIENDGVFVGYRGHDQFELVESELIRKFPIYKDNDKNYLPTGGTRIIIYKLKLNQNSNWEFEIFKTFDQKEKINVTPE